jgi:site-specific recombinase XerD
MRHAFATHKLGKAGLELIGAYLGHRDTRTTERYARIEASHLRAVVTPEGDD